MTVAIEIAGFVALFALAFLGLYHIWRWLDRHLFADRYHMCPECGREHKQPPASESLFKEEE